MKQKNITIGSHCWAIMGEKLLIVLRVNDGYEVCGAWECGCGEADVEIISIIKPPKNHKKTKLFYGEE